jgi:hypothetical protein
MMESPAYRALSLSAHRVIARIRIELAHHGGRDNGKLPVTFQDFEKFGIHRHSIAPAIREAEALGWIRTTQLGRSGNGEFRIPNMFALTHLDTEDGKASPNDWSKIEKLEEAEAIAAVASENSPGERRWKNRTPVSESAPQAVSESAPQNRNYRCRKVHRCHRQKPHHYLYLGYRALFIGGAIFSPRRKASPASRSARHRNCCGRNRDNSDGNPIASERQLQNCQASSIIRCNNRRICYSMSGATVPSGIGGRHSRTATAAQIAKPKHS